AGVAVVVLAPGETDEEVGVLACATDPLGSESVMLPMSSADTATRPPASPPMSTARRLPPEAGPEPDPEGAVVGWAAVSGWARLRCGGGSGRSCLVSCCWAGERRARVAASGSPPCCLRA